MLWSPLTPQAEVGLPPVTKEPTPMKPEEFYRLRYELGALSQLKSNIMMNVFNAYSEDQEPDIHNLGEILLPKQFDPIKRHVIAIFRPHIFAWLLKNPGIDPWEYEAEHGQSFHLDFFQFFQTGLIEEQRALGMDTIHILQDEPDGSQKQTFKFSAEALLS